MPWKFFFFMKWNNKRNSRQWEISDKKIHSFHLLLNIVDENLIYRFQRDFSQKLIVISLNLITIVKFHQQCTIRMGKRILIHSKLIIWLIYFSIFFLKFHVFCVFFQHFKFQRNFEVSIFFPILIMYLARQTS